MPRLLKYLFFTLAFLPFISFSANSGEWISLSESLHPNTLPLPDTLSSRHALSPSLTLWKGDLFAAWAEPDAHGIQQIYIKRFNRNKKIWEAVGRSHNKDRFSPSSTPFLGSSGKSLFLAWSEKNGNQASQVYVKEWNGSEWLFLGDSLNIDMEKEARNPVLTFLNDTPYVAWNELGEKEWSRLYVKHWEQKSWIADGPGFGLKKQHITMAPGFIFEGQNAHLVWPESDETRVFQIYYASLADGNWSVHKKSLNQDPEMQAFNPSLTLFNGALYLIFQEKNREGGFKLQLRHLTPEGWKNETEKIAGPGNRVFNPTLASNRQGLMLAWEDWDAQGLPGIVTQSISSSGITKVFAPLNDHPGHFGFSPLLVSGEQEIYLAWKENNQDDLYQIHIKKYSP